MSEVFTFSRDWARRIQRAVQGWEREGFALPKARGPVSSGSSANYPFKLYIAGGFLCCREGNHHWFNSFTNAVTTIPLEEDGTNSWPINAASTVYVQRTYNTDGTASVSLVRTADDLATVKGGQNATVMRFVIGTCTAAGVITQRWLGGDIDESRVA